MSPSRSSALEESAPIFAALGDATRLNVVARLAQGGPMSITQLTEGSEVTRQAVTKHLNVLSEAGLVVDFKRGRERVWELRKQRLADAGEILDEISQRWDDAIGRLKAMVEEQA